MISPPGLLQRQHLADVLFPRWSVITTASLELALAQIAQGEGSEQMEGTESQEVGRKC